MTDKFQNKYRTPPARLPNWDYSSNAAYFVPICIQSRECYFVQVENGEMILSETSKKGNQYWHNIPIHFPYGQLGEFVVMPNPVF